MQVSALEGILQAVLLHSRKIRSCDFEPYTGPYVLQRLLGDLNVALRDLFMADEASKTMPQRVSNLARYKIPGHLLQKELAELMQMYFRFCSRFGRPELKYFHGIQCPATSKLDTSDINPEVSLRQGPVHSSILLGHRIIQRQVEISQKKIAMQWISHHTPRLYFQSLLDECLQDCDLRLRTIQISSLKDADLPVLIVPKVFESKLPFKYLPPKRLPPLENLVENTGKNLKKRRGRPKMVVTSYGLFDFLGAALIESRFKSQWSVMDCELIEIVKLFKDYGRVIIKPGDDRVRSKKLQKALVEIVNRISSKVIDDGFSSLRLIFPQRGAPDLLTMNFDNNEKAPNFDDECPERAYQTQLRVIEIVCREAWPLKPVCEQKRLIAKLLAECLLPYENVEYVRAIACEQFEISGPAES